MDDMRYCFSKNVRIRKDDGTDEVTCAMFVYPTMSEAEIAFHTELAYGLSLNNLVLAHYSVTNEKGSVVFGLERTVDNTEKYKKEEPKNEEMPPMDNNTETES